MGDKSKILIVDDDISNRTMVKIALKNEAVEFIEAENGTEAITMLHAHHPDIILMDAIMPHMDGFETTKRLRLMPKFERTPVLMVTGLQDKEDRIKALEVGVNDFISKPFDKNELRARCLSYIKMSKLNERYISASSNPTTGLPNKLKLFESMFDQSMLLIWVAQHEKIEEFYGQKIANQAESFFAEHLKNALSILKDASLYHTANGEFALLYDSDLQSMSYQEIENEILRIIQETKEDSFYLKEFDTTIISNLFVSYITPKKNMYELSRSALKLAAKTSRSFINADDIAETLQEKSTKNIVWMQKVKKALEENRIEAFFQPLYHNKSNKILKYESLVRLIDEDGEIISPFFFLDVAQKSNQYIDITKAVFDQAVDFFAHKEEGFSINLSGIDIENDELREYLIETLESKPHIAQKIVFEMLEDEHFTNYETLRKFIHKVKALGAKIAIDDFGSGYSNFIRLLDFEPDILKIDGSLIKNIAHDEFSLNVVKTIKDFADKQNLQVVAEFVCNKEVFDIITALDIDFSQGFYIDKPLSKSEIKAKQ